MSFFNLAAQEKRLDAEEEEEEEEEAVVEKQMTQVPALNLVGQL